MKEFENLQDIQLSIGELRKHLENADYLISNLESDLDEHGAYRYVDSAMYDLKTTYKDLLDYVDSLERTLDEVVEDSEET